MNSDTNELTPLKLHMGPAKCAVDLGDGSERGEYVGQDYWPYSIAERSGKSHKRIKAENLLEDNRFSLEHFKKVNGGIPKPLVISELNADGDVTGPYEQAELMKDFYFTVRDNKATWLTGLTYYQFRDRGRLGMGKWFYKKPGVKTVDLMPAFFNKPLKGAELLTFKLFAPPPDGVNDPSQGDDWAVNYRTTVNSPPRFRIRYEPTETGFYVP